MWTGEARNCKPCTYWTFPTPEPQPPIDHQENAAEEATYMPCQTMTEKLTINNEVFMLGAKLAVSKLAR